MAWLCAFSHLQFSQNATQANELAAVCSGELRGYGCKSLVSALEEDAVLRVSGGRLLSCPGLHLLPSSSSSHPETECLVRGLEPACTLERAQTLII